MFETSARENINVEETFRAITKLVIKSRKEQKARLENDGGGGHGGRGGQGNDPIRYYMLINKFFVTNIILAESLSFHCI